MTTMARPKKDLSTVSVPKSKPNVSVLCTKCGIEKNAQKDFYMSYDSKISIVPFCKECTVSNSLSDDKTYIDLERFQNVLQQLDKPYLHQVFVTNSNKYDDPVGLIGKYMKDIHMKQYRALRFSNSDFGHLEEQTTTVDNKPKKQTRKKTEKIGAKTRSALIDKWGEFEDDKLSRFEKKYNEMSKGYQILTVMHEEALCNYCKLQTLYELALEQNNTQEAKLYGDLAKQARSDAKLNPNQLKKEDFQTGGANSFGEIARIVSKDRGNIKLPMKYVLRPQDAVDWAMVEYINYLRGMKNMPEIEHKDLYAWYIDRINSFNNKHNSDVLKSDMGDLEDVE